MKALIRFLALTLLTISLLTGCNGKEDEAIVEAIQIAEATFNETKQEPTESSDLFSFYLPKEYKVKEKSEHNIILKKDNQEYILFVNPNEALDSEVLFNELQAAKKEVQETFKSKGRFGYLLITPVEGKNYEVIVGIGGVKMTTLSTVDDIARDTKKMMEIANSVEYDAKQKEEKEQTDKKQ
ncbi:hypothetical protein [Calidifontibacillus erzurumensis]|uniref:hypothetical protein n=1 Tax=Calidifontibacillus erzurumensis TaxID=2741433 RepID=UPI0035B52BC9